MYVKLIIDSLIYSTFPRINTSTTRTSVGSSRTISITSNRIIATVSMNLSLREPVLNFIILLRCSKGISTLLKDPAAERIGLHCATDPALGGRGRISPFSPRSLGAKMGGNACGLYICRHLVSASSFKGNVNLVHTDRSRL